MLSCMAPEIPLRRRTNVEDIRTLMDQNITSDNYLNNRERRRMKAMVDDFFDKGRRPIGDNNVGSDAPNTDNDDDQLNDEERSRIQRLRDLGVPEHLHPHRLRRQININNNNNNSDNDDDDYDDNDDDDYYEGEPSRMQRWRKAIRKCGVFGLALALVGPVVLHFVEIFFFRSPQSVEAIPSWFPKKKVEVVSIFVSVVISLSFWFGWAEKGVRRPVAVATLYLGYMASTWAWHWVLFDLGALKMGFVVSLAKFLFGFVLSEMLKELNETASEVVMKSCGMWAHLAVMFNAYLLIW